MVTTISSPLVITILVVLCVRSSLAIPANTAAITQTTYNNLQRFAYYASATYIPNCNTIQSTGIVQQTFLNMSSKTQGFIAKDTVLKQITVAFKGSTSEQDFINDANILQTGYSSPISGQHCLGCTVHQGFFGCWNSVKNVIVPAVTALHNANPSFTIVVVGHSLGGALTTFCALQLKGSIPGIVLQVYSYGEPRVGSSLYANFVDNQLGTGNIFRTTHTTDAVPQLIPKTYVYQHHSTEYFIYQDPSSLANVVKCTNGQETSTCNDATAVSWSTTIDLFGANSPHHTYLGIGMGDRCL